MKYKALLAATVAALTICSISEAHANNSALQTLTISPTAYADEVQDYYQGAYVFSADERDVINGGLVEGGVSVDGGLLFSGGEGGVTITRDDGAAFSVGSIDLASNSPYDSSEAIIFDYANGTSIYTPLVLTTSLQTIDFDQSGLTAITLSDYSGGVHLSQLTLTDISAAPEPSTWALMMVGIGSLGLMLRGSKKQAWALSPA